MDPTMSPYPMTDFERGLAYGEMKSSIESLRDRISRLEFERENAEQVAARAEDIATDALREVIDAREEIAEVADEIEQTSDVVETAVIADAIADAAVSDAISELDDESEPVIGTEIPDVTVIGGDEAESAATDTPRQEPEVERESHPQRHRRGGVYGRRR